LIINAKNNKLLACREEELEEACPSGDVWDGEWRPQAVRRLVQRYVGQCNLQTDIKEAVFLGQDDQLVAAGSDDGNVYIFNTVSGHLARRYFPNKFIGSCEGHPLFSGQTDGTFDRMVHPWP
jgi:hypothetical protein